MKLTMRQRREGEKIPRGYGIAYFNVPRYTWVLFPIPFNLIVKWARQFLWYLKKEHYKMEALWKAHEQGFDKSKKRILELMNENFDLKEKTREESHARYREGYEKGWNACVQKMEGMIDERSC